MTYEKLKAFNLNDIKSQEQADEFKAKVLESNKTDILKYINFLRWQQFNSNVDIKYINRIVSLLSFDEIMDIEKAMEQGAKFMEITVGTFVKKIKLNTTFAA